MGNRKSFAVGSFSCPTLGELRQQTQTLMLQMPGTLRVSNVTGDVATMHADKENLFALFQVASQFNCLEFVEPQSVPELGVTCYERDRTQGPACSPAARRPSTEITLC